MADGGGSRRGGARQRLQRGEAPGVESKLAAHLLRQWAWGFMSPQQVQYIAMLAKQDIEAAGGRKVPALDTLAALGSGGTQSNNMHRDLRNNLPTILLPSPSLISVPVKANNVRGFNMAFTECVAAA